MSRRTSYPYKITLLVALLAMASFFLTGCLEQPQQGQPGGKAPMVVTIWHSLQGAEAAALQGELDKLVAGHPEIIVESKYVPESNYVSLAYQAEAGGEGPEVFIARWEILDQLYALGALAPVVTANTEAEDSALESFRYGNDYFARPWLTDVAVLYYRTDLVKAPQDLTGLMEGEEVTATSLSMANLSALWGAQGGKLSAGQQPTLDSVANQEFLSSLLTWRDKKNLVIGPQAFNLFVKGEAAYYIGWASQAQLLSKSNVAWGSISLTDLTTGQGQPLLGTTLGIANSAIKTTEGRTAGIRLVEDAVLTPEVEGAMARAGRRLPANTDYYALPEAGAGVYPAAKKALDSAWLLEGNALERKLIPVLEQAWTKGFNGELNVQEALAQAQTEAKQVLAPAP